MAISKILYIGDCGSGYAGKHLKQALDYIVEEHKTGEGKWVASLNCQVDNAYEQMRKTKQHFGKTDQRQGYHMIISFAEGEVDAETAFEVIGRFAKEYLGQDYEALYSVHDNTEHIHGHLIFNSVSFRTGKKYRYEKGDWAKKIQPITNRLCEEYGLSTIEISEDRARPSENYKEWKSIIDRCIRKLYIEIARSREKYVPVMSDFYEILMNQPEEEAKDIALSLELFVNGSLNIFNHQTNVDVDNRFTVYGIRDLGTELSPITMLVMMESIQNRIIENGKRGVATWLYIDEFHVLLNSEYSAKYLQQLWKKVRKQGGLCTGITQNVVDLLQNYTATTMLANSEFVALLKQANTDSFKMAEVIGVSEAQLRFVTNTQSGMGLMKCGNVVIPFDNTIEKGTDLYNLYNTNIHEKIEEEKKQLNCSNNCG